MTERRRVVVTGLGVISSIGHDCATFWESICNGATGIRPIDPEVGTFGFANVAAVRDFDPEKVFESRSHQSVDRFAQFALVAAREAIRDCGLIWTDEMRIRTGVVTGCGIGGAIAQDRAYQRLYLQGKKRLQPLTVPNIMPNAGASHVSMDHGFRGPSFTLSTACASSTHAIGMAAGLIRSGLADRVITGGSEALLNRGSLSAWDALRVVSRDTCRPFNKQLNGMILGEGGAMLVLESLDDARQRGARIYGEVAGFGMSADAHHLTAPALDGPVTAIRAALTDAGFEPSDIDYVNAHGTGTEGNDPNEVRAIETVFGDHARRLAVSSTKAMHGHTIGAAGAIEAVVTMLAMHHGVLPPTLNVDEVHPDCKLDLVPNEPRPAQIRTAMSNSFAFGGLNAVLAFRGA